MSSAEWLSDTGVITSDLLFRHHPQPMWIVDDADLRILEVNVAALERYGLDRHAFLARRLPDLWVTPPALLASSVDPYVVAAALNGPNLHRHGDGSEMDVVLRVRPVRSPQASLLLVVADAPIQPTTAARDEAALFAALLEQGSDAVLVLDSASRVVHANERAAAMLGGPIDALMRLPLRALLNGADELDGAISGLSDMGPIRAETELLRMDGGLVPCSMRLRALPDGRTLVLLHDMTMQRTAERVLASRDHRFRALIQNTTDIILIVDASSRPIYLSPSAMKLGFPDPVGRRANLTTALHPRDRARVLSWFEGLLRRDSDEVVALRYRVHGAWRWFEVVGSNLIDDADVGGLVLNARDVTMRREAEWNLRKSEAYYRALFEKSLEGVMLFRSDRTIQTISGPALRLLSYNVSELIDRDRSDLIHEDDRDAFLDALDLIEARAGSSEHVRYRFRDGTGSWRWLEGTVTNLLNDADVGAIVLNFREIGDRIRAMEKINALNNELRRRLAHMQSLRRIDMAITNSVDLRLVLDIFMDQMLADMGVDAVAILLFDPHTADLTPFVGRGFATDVRHSARTVLGAGPAGRAAREQRTVYIPDLQAEEERGAAVEASTQSEFVSYLAVPMLAKGQLQGVIELYGRRTLSPTDEWLEFLETYGDQGAIAIENSQLLRSLERTNTELQDAYDRTIEGWAFALDLKDEETAGHSKRVTETTVRLARRLGISAAACVHVQRGALLHDIGKMGIPDNVLLKGAELTEAEFELMKRHTIYAYELLAPIEFLRPALDIPYCHHEKWDGSGYPRGLSGKQIPLSARIFAVVDVFDALISDRPYRPAWSRDRAFSYIRAESGRHFDPQVVEGFFQMMAVESTDH